MKTKDFLEDYDPQIAEVGHENYTYTPKQVIERLEAYEAELKIDYQDSVIEMLDNQIAVRLDIIKNGYTEENWRRYQVAQEQLKALGITKEILNSI